jgi:hypothetical protein
MMERKSFVPSSLKLWMDEGFKTKMASNMQQVLQRANDTEIAIDMICHGKIFKAGNSYGISLSVYPINPAIPPSYYFRSFANFNSIESVLKDMVLEMELRCNTPSKPYFEKSIYIKKFNINFHTFSKLEGDDVSFIDLPYIKIAGSSYKTDENFFSEILLYNIHISRLFNVWNGSIKNYISTSESVPSSIDYVVSTDIDISEQFSMLTISIINNKSQKIVTKYKYPFKSLNLNDLYATMRENAQNIILSVISSEERKQVGIVQLDLLDKFQPVYCENYYLGDGKQYGLVFPSGSSNLLISNEKYKIFISPFTLNNKTYKLSEAYILDMKK